MSINDTKVLAALSNLSNSMYHGISTQQLSEYLAPTDARRYLSTIIIINDKEKANFDRIQEVSSAAEQDSG